MVSKDVILGPGLQIRTLLQSKGKLYFWSLLFTNLLSKAFTFSAFSLGLVESCYLTIDELFDEIFTLLIKDGFKLLLKKEALLGTKGLKVDKQVIALINLGVNASTNLS